MTEQKEQGRTAGGKAPDDTGHAGDKPAAGGGEEHPVDQKVQEETGKERAANRGYD